MEENMSLNKQTAGMDKKALLSSRKVALVAGVLYLFTFA